MSIISLRQKIAFGNLVLALSHEEVAMLQLISTNSNDVLKYWSKLWNNINDYEEFPFSCKELMPTAIKKMQEIVPQNNYQKYILGNSNFLSGLPRYTWTKNQYIINQYRIIATALENENIEFIAIKGVCEILADSNLSMMRTSRDIDILIHQKDWVKCKKIFSDLGWKMYYTSNPFHGLRSPLSIHAETFYSKERIMDLDVHFSAVSGLKEYSKKFTEELWKKKVSVPKYPNLFIPSKEDRFIITTANAYNTHNWGSGQICKYLFDAINITNTMDSVQIEKALLKGEIYLQIGDNMTLLLKLIKELTKSNNIGSSEYRKYVPVLQVKTSMVKYFFLLQAYQHLIRSLFTGPEKAKNLVVIFTSILFIIFISIPRNIAKIFKKIPVQNSGGLDPKSQVSWYLYSKLLS
jgi:hypothetical protein